MRPGRWIVLLFREEDYPSNDFSAYCIEDEDAKRLQKITIDGEDYRRPPASNLTITYTGAKRLLIGIQHCPVRLQAYVDGEGALTLKEVIIEAENWWRFYYYGKLLVQHEIRGDHRVLDELHNDYDEYNPREEPHKTLIHEALVKCGEVKE